MEKLYYIDRYLKSCTSSLLDVKKLEEYTAIRFKESILFPGGGGQKADRGTIEVDGNVFEVMGYTNINNNEYVLVSNSAMEILRVGEKVSMKIDWEHREDNMHQHTGQHILSGCFYTLFGNNTLGLHIGEDFSQLDIEGLYKKDDIIKIENYANEVIEKSIEIENYPIDESEKNSTRRALPNTDDEIRILRIGELDINACCGVHAKNTRDIRIIKIKKFYKHKNGTRIEYLAGNRAIKHLLERDVVFERILNKFNCGDSNIENAIANLEDKNIELYEQNKYLLEKLVSNIVDSLLENSEITESGIRLVLNRFNGEKDVLIEEIVKKLSSIDNTVSIITNENKDKIDLKLASSKNTSKYYGTKLGVDFKTTSEGLDIKGGGSDFRVTGFSRNKKDVDIFFEKIYSIYIKK